MKDMIYCKTTAKDTQSFYLKTENDKIFLFSQAYRRGVADYYRNGVTIDAAIDYSKSHRNDALTRTMTKIPMYLRYIEKEYGIAVLEQTRRRRDSYRYLKCA